MVLNKFFISVIALFLLVSCQGGVLSTENSPHSHKHNEMQGGVQPSGQVTGTLLSPALASAVGSKLDNDDMRYYHESSQHTLENFVSGRKGSWLNPNTGHLGSIVPIRTFEENKVYCRDFVQSINIDGKNYEDSGTACRTLDGKWVIKN